MDRDNTIVNAYRDLRTLAENAPDPEKRTTRIMNEIHKRGLMYGLEGTQLHDYIAQSAHAEVGIVRKLREAPTEDPKQGRLFG